MQSAPLSKQMLGLRAITFSAVSSNMEQASYTRSKLIARKTKIKNAKKKKKTQNNKKPPSKSKSGIHAKNLREKSLNMISYWNHNEGGSGDIFVPYITEKS